MPFRMMTHLLLIILLMISQTQRHCDPHITMLDAVNGLLLTIVMSIAILPLHVKPVIVVVVVDFVMVQPAVDGVRFEVQSAGRRGVDLVRIDRDSVAVDPDPPFAEALGVAEEVLAGSPPLVPVPKLRGCIVVVTPLLLWREERPESVLVKVR